MKHFLSCLSFLLLLFPIHYAFANEESSTTTITESFDENGWTSVISYDSGGASNAVTNN